VGGRYKAAPFSENKNVKEYEIQGEGGGKREKKRRTSEVTTVRLGQKAFNNRGGGKISAAN